MARLKTERIALNIRPRAEIMTRFDIYCKEVGQTKTLAFERMVMAYLERYEQEKKALEELKRTAHK